VFDPDAQNAESHAKDKVDFSSFAWPTLFDGRAAHRNKRRQNGASKMKFVSLNMVEPGAVRFDEDTGREVRDEVAKPVVINAATIRAFYARRDGKTGTRITFADGGGFAVRETPDVVAQAVATGDVNLLALAPPVSQTAN
jgi:hypothetical protein